MIKKLPSLPQILKERRLDTGIKQGQIGEPLGIDQTTVSLYEREPKRLKARGVEFTINFIKKYGFDDADARRLAQELFDDVLREFSLEPTIPPNAALATADGPKAMYYGPVSAGIKGDGKSIKPYLVNIPSWLAKKYNPADIFVLTVDGDSMTCDDIRKSIPEGTEVYFHSKLDPHPGEVVTVWLENCDFNVIKIYKPQRDQTVLQSYNFKHPPIIIDEANPARVQGVYVGESKPSWTRFDR